MKKASPKKVFIKQSLWKLIGLDNFVYKVAILTTLSSLFYIGLQVNRKTDSAQNNNNQYSWGSNQQLLSSHHCKGTSPVQRICYYQNLLLYKDTLYYIIDDKFQDNTTFPDVDLAIISNQIGEGVVEGSKIERVRYEDSPLTQVDKYEEINIGLFQHRYAEMTYERTLLAHTPLLHLHLCENFEICSPEHGQNATVVFWDDLSAPVHTWEKAAQQVWSCFSKQSAIELSVSKNNASVAYLFRNAVVGIGHQCLDFFGCNSRVVGTARRSLLWGNTLREWRQKIQQCALIVRKETFKKDTRFVFKWKYQGPQNIRLDSDSGEKRLIRFIDQAEGTPKFQGIQQMADAVEGVFGKHLIETKKLQANANLWERIDLFTQADIIISPYWEALSGLVFMKNCSCLVVVYPYGVEPIFYNQQVDVLQYGSVGLSSYFGQHLQMYVFGYTIPNPAKTLVDWEAVAQSDDRFNQLPEETRNIVKKELKCGREEWSKDCQLKWIAEHSTIHLDIAYFILSLRFGMKTTDLCFKNTYPSELAYEMWPISSCIPAVFEDLQGWLVNSAGVGRVLPPGNTLNNICSEDCNVVDGWIHGEIVAVEEWDYPQECCDACKRNENCNAWNFCQCFDRCGDYHRRACILKNVQPSPAFAYIQGDISYYNRFIGGIPNVGNINQIQQCSPKIITDKESEEYKTHLSMECPSEDCNVQTGNFTNSKMLDDEILKVITDVDNQNTNMTPVECCQHCKEQEKCNIWTLCNSPEGCPCDINAKGTNGCNNGMLQPFTCVLKFSVNVKNGIRPAKFETGKFTSLVSGYLQEKKQDDNLVNFTRQEENR